MAQRDGGARTLEAFDQVDLTVLRELVAFRAKAWPLIWKESKRGVGCALGVAAAASAVVPSEDMRRETSDALLRHAPEARKAYLSAVPVPVPVNPVQPDSNDIDSWYSGRLSYLVVPLLLAVFRMCSSASNSGVTSTPAPKLESYETELCRDDKAAPDCLFSHRFADAVSLGRCDDLRTFLPRLKQLDGSHESAVMLMLKQASHLCGDRLVAPTGAAPAAAPVEPPAPDASKGPSP